MGQSFGTPLPQVEVAGPEEGAPLLDDDGTPLKARPKRRTSLPSPMPAQPPPDKVDWALAWQYVSSLRHLFPRGGNLHVSLDGVRLFLVGEVNQYLVWHVDNQVSG